MFNTIPFYNNNNNQCLRQKSYRLAVPSLMRPLQYELADSKGKM